MCMPAAEARRLSGADAKRVKFFTLGNGSPLHATLRDREHPKVCPACLVDAPFLLAAWDLRLWTACPIHGCAMADACPDCGGRHDWERRRLDGGCASSPKLDARVSPAAEAGAVDFVRCIARAAGIEAPAPSIRVGELLAGLDMSRISKLAHRLSAVEQWDGAADLILVSTWYPDLEEAASAVAAAGRFLQGWPNTFHQVIERAWSATKTRNGTSEPKRESFKKLMVVFSGSHLDFIREEFAAYFTRRFEPTLTRVSRRPTERDAISTGAAEEMLGLKKGTVKRWVAARKIRARTIVSKGQEVLLIERNEIAAVSRRELFHLPYEVACNEAGALSRAEAAVLLGIRRNGIEDLIESGLLGSKDVSVHFANHYSRAVIEALLARFGASGHAGAASDHCAPVFEESGLVDTVALTEVSGQFSLVDLLRALERLGIAPDVIVDQEVGLRKLRYGKEKVAQIRLAAAGGFLTQERASLELGCSAASVRTLLSSSVLEEAPSNGPTGARGSGKPRMISAASLAALATRLVSTGGLARALGMHPNGLRVVLDSLALEPTHALGTAETTLWSCDEVVTALCGAGYPLTKDQLRCSGRAPEKARTYALRQPREELRGEISVRQANCKKAH